jgi:hypothetical protein
MTTVEKLQSRLDSQTNALPAFQMLEASGNKIAQGYAEQMRDDIRWLSWVLARAGEDG